jgi:hypothetical protein
MAVVVGGNIGGGEGCFFDYSHHHHHHPAQDPNKPTRYSEITSWYSKSAWIHRQNHE